MTAQTEAYWSVGEFCLRKDGAPPVFGVAISVTGTTISLDPDSAKHMASLILLSADKVQKDFECEQARKAAKVEA